MWIIDRASPSTSFAAAAFQGLLQGPHGSLPESDSSVDCVKSEIYFLTSAKENKIKNHLTSASRAMGQLWPVIFMTLCHYVSPMN